MYYLYTYTTHTHREGRVLNFDVSLWLQWTTIDHNVLKSMTRTIKTNRVSINEVHGSVPVHTGGRWVKSLKFTFTHTDDHRLTFVLTSWDLPKVEWDLHGCHQGTCGHSPSSLFFIHENMKTMRTCDYRPSELSNRLPKMYLNNPTPVWFFWTSKSTSVGRSQSVDPKQWWYDLHIRRGPSVRV